MTSTQPQVVVVKRSGCGTIAIGVVAGLFLFFVVLPMVCMGSSILAILGIGTAAVETAAERTPAPTPTRGPRSAFTDFEPEFEQWKATRAADEGYTVFIRAELDWNIVQVVTTDAWSNLTETIRASDVDTVLTLWRSAYPTGIVQFVNISGGVIIQAPEIVEASAPPATTITELPGRTLYAATDRVLVRGNPNRSAAPVITVGLGHELVEFSREGEWINVGVAKSNGKDGWVRIDETVLERPAGGRTVAAETTQLRALKATIDQLKAMVGRDTILACEDHGDGIVRLTVDRAGWNGASQIQRSRFLDQVFERWSGLNSGLPSWVEVYDDSGLEIDGRHNR